MPPLRKETNRTKLYQGKNEETNMGACVCLLDNAIAGTPEKDIVVVCLGRLDKKKRPKTQMVMTVDEAQSLGVALIGAFWLKRIRNSSHKEN